MDARESNNVSRQGSRGISIPSCRYKLVNTDLFDVKWNNAISMLQFNQSDIEGIVNVESLHSPGLLVRGRNVSIDVIIEVWFPHHERNARR